MKNRGICKKCKKEIWWIKTEKGAMMPCDIKMQAVVTEEGKTIMGNRPHWASCPHANHFRKRNEKEAEIKN
jgi:hypothetical protein